MRRVIRSLEHTNNQMEEIDSRLKKQTKDVILQEMAAVVQNNTLPNYFLFKPAADGPRPYRQGALVFLHHPRAAGSALTACLDGIAHNRSMAASPVMDSDERLRWAIERESDGETARTNRDRFAVHRGRFSFGMCSDISRKCSHFTLLREPMSRAVSSFRYCQTAYGDEMCRVANANKLSLREWIIHQGSILFRQLLFQPSWCHLDDNVKTDNATTDSSSPPNSSSEQHRKSAADPDHVPCWYKHKLHFDDIPTDMKRHLLDYVVNNLDQWFAAIGLFEDLVPSLKMFEHVYDLPFTQCLNFQRKTTNNAEIFDNRSNRKKRLNPETDDLDNDPEYLKYDYAVQQALEADIRIYREAKKLFRIQRQNLFNKVTR